ncbi:DUF3017 domain-containing protein [Actinomadura craniellae]|uniref:DUF3017 domain-containing protein n=1 Tax=Actinomadura craniellae TaxID=2231787 RepID=A0A365H7H8_9ACTN|nr:DUF3017 domain-containing protein [Actinomadura craniellae]RAY15070.1 DUF3017 domain-containing protein [Actinomadura craniellae]
MTAQGDDPARTLTRRRRTAAQSRGGAPHWLGQLPYVMVLVGVGAGLTMFGLGHFRRGSALVAAAVLLGALARAVLLESQVGMLATRKKWLDVLTMVAFAVTIVTVAWTISK